MYNYCLLLVILVLANCGQRDNNAVPAETPLGYLDSIKAETSFATISFFRDLKTTSMTFVKPVKEQSSIDFIFTFIGEMQTDATCYFPKDHLPVGFITFYKDTLMEVELKSLYFSLDNRCKGFYKSFNDSSKCFELTSIGNKYLSEERNRLERHWKR